MAAPNSSNKNSRYLKTIWNCPKSSVLLYINKRKRDKMIHTCKKCGNDFLTEADAYVVRPTHAGVELYCQCQIKNTENTMREWITDRRPINDDEEYVFNGFGDMVHYLDIKQGEPWMRIERPEPYVKPKRYEVKETTENGWFVRHTNDFGYLAHNIPTREAAERIAEIYEETMP